MVPSKSTEPGMPTLATSFDRHAAAAAAATTRPVPRLGGVWGTLPAMPNTQIAGHPLVGTGHAYRADLEPYDPAAEREPGTPIIGNGHHVEILAVFKDWNGVNDLDMLYVRCRETGQSTHVTPADLSLPALD